MTHGETIALVSGLMGGSLVTIVSFFYWAVSDSRRKAVSLIFENYLHESTPVVRVNGHVLGERVDGVLLDDERAALGMIVWKVRDRWNKT